MSQYTDVIFEVLSGKQGQVGVITLNRPQQLNALTQDMLIALYDQLSEWQIQTDIQAVLVMSASEKAFCAGGDIKSLYAWRHDIEKAQQFFRDEYGLNQLIYAYRKPYIAILNGLTMGGGAGISINGSYRVATEKLRFAMPETGIGLFPDVGGSYFLSRCRNFMGRYLGLTGVSIDAAAAGYLGLVNYYSVSDRLPRLLPALLSADWDDDPHQVVRSILEAMTEPFPQASLERHAEVIAHSFQHDSMEAIFASLEQGTDFARETLALLKTRSPTSLKVTLAQLQRGKELSFAECMQMEYGISTRCLRGHDLYEGIRAAVIDKDRDPRWQPQQLAQVTVADVATYFV